MEELIKSSLLAAVDSESFTLDIIGLLEGSLDSSGEILGSNWLVLELLAASDDLRDLADQGALGEVVHQVGVSSVDEVRVQDCSLVEVLESVHLSVVADLNRGVLVFGPVELVLKRANSNQALGAVLLGQTGSSLEEVVLVS